MACTIPVGPDNGRLRILPQCGRAIPLGRLPCEFTPKNADLSVEIMSLTPGQPAYFEGDELTFSIRVRNLGAVAAVSSTLTFTDEGLTAPQVVNLGTVSPGASVLVDIFITVPEVISGDTWTATVTVATVTPESDYENNVDTMDFDTLGTTDIEVLIFESQPS